MLGKDRPLGSIDRAKMNVKGSSIAYGHPFAATGGRIIAMLAKILEENGGGRGLISICTAGGMGVCAIMERPRSTNGAARIEQAWQQPTMMMPTEAPPQSGGPEGGEHSETAQLAIGDQALPNSGGR
jgi:acetyl-CoA C-acetyltransferase